MKYVYFDIETTGLTAWFDDSVTCICAKDSDGNTFEWVNDDNSETRGILNFYSWLKERKDYQTITYNGKSFDIPFMMTRLALIGVVELSPMKLNHLDLMVDLGVKKWLKMDEMARLLNCSSKNGSGLQAVRLFHDKQYGTLLDYCRNDVVVLEKIHKKLIEIGTLKE